MNGRGAALGGLIGAALVLAFLLILDFRRPAAPSALPGDGAELGPTNPARARLVGQPVRHRYRESDDGAAGGATNLISTSARPPAASKPAVAKPDAIPGERVLTFATDAELNRFEEWAKSRGLNVVGGIPSLRALRVRAAEGTALEDLLKESPVTARSELNLRLRSPELPSNPLPEPDKPYMAFGPRTLAWLGVPADNMGWGKGVTVAVLDTGVQPHLSLLENHITRVDLVNEMEGGGTGEHSWHGTAVASLIAGNSPDLRGVAPAVDILSIKVMGSDGSGDSFTIARGIIEAVDRGARVVNICLGTHGNSGILEDAVKYAVGKGVAVVAATGNDGMEGVFYPARYDGVVAVAGVDALERHVYFANRGPQVDIAAPAIGLSAAWGADSVAMFSGTSAAAPLVSGALAWLLGSQPGMTVEQATQLLQQYSNDSVSVGRDDEVGAGILSVRRLQERERRGIRDMAMLPFYVPASDPGERFVSVWCMAQNRGTEPLSVVDLKLTVGGQSESAVFYNVAVGQTISRERRVDLEGVRATPMSVVAEVSIRGETDAYPGDNRRESLLTPRDE